LFTGIIQEIGKLKGRKKARDKYQLEINCQKVLVDINKGDSIAVNGVCLTVVEFSKDSFIADVMPETLRATNLVNLLKGSAVNLEQAVRADGFFGGHLVSGHVDGTAKVKNIRSEKNAKLVEIAIDDELTKFMVDKGSVTLNGVSLTIVRVEQESFSVSLIPETWSYTNLKNIKPGTEINVETDLIGKYVVKLMQQGQSKHRTSIDKNLLAENGFI